MKNILMTLIIVTHTGLALAQKTGNGGDAVVKGEQVSLLDLVENQNEIFVPKDEEIIQLAQLAMSKINWIISSPKKIAWILTPQNLPEIQDEGYLDYRETDAEIKQLAIQKDDVVLINKNLFGRLPKKHQIGLVIHELLINTAIKIGKNLNTEQGTRNIRQITSLILAKNPEEIPADYIMKIWDSIPNLPNTPAALNINRPSTDLWHFRSTGLIPYTLIKIKKPMVEVNGRYYPILVTDLNLRHHFTAGPTCQVFGLDNYLELITEDLNQTTEVVDISDGKKNIVTVGPRKKIINYITCIIKEDYFRSVKTLR